MLEANLPPIRHSTHDFHNPHSRVGLVVSKRLNNAPVWIAQDENSLEFGLFDDLLKSNCLRFAIITEFVRVGLELLLQSVVARVSALPLELSRGLSPCPHFLEEGIVLLGFLSRRLC